ncbi:META domain-containing protein [Tenggerimyces flavus]|uniref:META domain-containing protein n=1 Tax=Tenggerimyces flavus TaxID=1708749 RepID=A0ABV7Y698_9ACTN|nr:META domain-containing protein [Tenggerimyces flavus]MBM7785241.1 heat shock protein HslJ [Tenggerimyces flavus]
MRIGLLALALGVVTLAASACGDQTAQTTPGGSGSDDSQLEGRTFLSSSVMSNGKPYPLVSGTQISLWFPEDGRLVANAGCNTIGGEKVQLSDGKLSASGLGMTEMGCDAPRHKQDEWLVGVLEAGPTWKLNEATLTLTSGETVLTLVDKKVAQPDLPIEGTKWAVSTIYTGDVASNTAGMDKAFLVFADGKVTGSTGCNRLNGTATISGSEITFGPIATTKMGCADPLMQVEKSVLLALEGTVPFSIDSSALTLNHPKGANGLGLTGTAQ